MTTATTTTTRPPRTPIAERPLTMPFTVICDSREQAPYTFTGLVGDSREHNRPLIVPTVVKGLATGDYSIQGFEHLIAIERKSTADLLGTLAQRMEQFRAEHERMRAIVFRGGLAAVVIEANPAHLHLPSLVSQYTRLSPRAIHEVQSKWLARYCVPWICAGDRRGGELRTWSLLRQFWNLQEEKRKEAAKANGQDQSFDGLF